LATGEQALYGLAPTAGAAVEVAVAEGGRLESSPDDPKYDLLILTKRTRKMWVLGIEHHV